MQAIDEHRVWRDGNWGLLQGLNLRLRLIPQCLTEATARWGKTSSGIHSRLHQGAVKNCSAGATNLREDGGLGWEFSSLCAWPWGLRCATGTRKASSRRTCVRALLQNWCRCFMRGNHFARGQPSQTPNAKTLSQHLAAHHAGVRSILWTDWERTAARIARRLAQRKKLCEIFRDSPDGR